MNYKIDHCEPFDNKKENIWMKCEHVGRYLFAIDFFANLNAKKILDVACAEGFGSYLLSKSGFEVFGADINAEYVKKRIKDVEANLLCWILKRIISL